LAISAFCHDSAACRVVDGEILAPAQERAVYPKEAKFERLRFICARGLRSFLMSMPVWMTEKAFLKKTPLRELDKIQPLSTPTAVLFGEHHESHAASAFYNSPYDRAAVLCLDAVGEWATSSAWLGEGHLLRPLWEIPFPHTLGLLYSAFTYHAGFKVECVPSTRQLPNSV
jgi:carbamoyltransferase